MKKIHKLLVTGLLLSGFIFPAAGCVQPPEPFVPPESSGGKVTINDAYDWNEAEDGSTRPNLGDDYEAVVPVKDVLLTIAEGSSVRFKGGESTFKLPVGSYLKPTDFDESTTGGNDVCGIFTLDENNEVVTDSFKQLSEFEPAAETVIMPCFAHKNSDYIGFGTNKIGDYVVNENGVDLTINTIGYALKSENAYLDGFYGKKITGDVTHDNSKISYFRSVSTTKVEAGQTYTYHYYIKNFSDKTITLHAYQMLTGHAWDNLANRVPADPITLAPGEGKSVSLKLKATTANANALTLFRFEEPVETISLGVAMSIENSTPTKPATIHLNLPEGFTVADSYKREVRTNDKLVLPTANQIINKTEHRLLGWVYANSNNTPVTEGVRIKGDITIEPLLTQDVRVEFFNLPNGFAVNSKYKSVFQEGDLLILPTEAQLDNTTGHKVAYWLDDNGRQINAGTVLSEDIKLTPVLTEDIRITLELPEGFTVTSDYKITAQTGDKLVLPTASQIQNNTGHNIIRWVDGNNQPVTNNTLLTGDITIKPELTADALVRFVLPENFSLKDYDGLNGDNELHLQTGDRLTLPTAEQINNTTGNRFIRWVDENGKPLANTVQLTGDLTIKPELTQAAKITVRLPEGLTVKGEYQTDVQTGDKLLIPELEGEKAILDAIKGWYIVGNGNQKVDANTIILDTELTIAPYWQQANGYEYVAIGSGANSGYNSDETYGSVGYHLGAHDNTATGSVKYSTGHIVSGGESGQAAQGVTLSDSLPVKAGSIIRFDSKRTAVTGKYEFSYAFENRGNSDLKLSVYQINASSEYRGLKFAYENSRYRVEINLKPGESITKLGQYDLSSNGNWLTIIVIEQDVESFEFGVAIGYKSITNIDAAYQNQAALNNPANIQYNAEENGGIVVKDSYLKQRAGHFITVPTENDIEVPAGITVEKWQLIVDGVAYDIPAKVTDWKNLMVPSVSTLKAVLKENANG